MLSSYVTLLVLSNNNFNINDINVFSSKKHEIDQPPRRQPIVFHPDMKVILTTLFNVNLFVSDYLNMFVMIVMRHLSSICRSRYVALYWLNFPLLAFINTSLSWMNARVCLSSSFCPEGLYDKVFYRCYYWFVFAWIVRGIIVFVTVIVSVWFE